MTAPPGFRAGHAQARVRRSSESAKSPSSAVGAERPYPPFGKKRARGDSSRASQLDPRRRIQRAPGARFGSLVGSCGTEISTWPCCIPLVDGDTRRGYRPPRTPLSGPSLRWLQQPIFHQEIIDSLTYQHRASNARLTSQLFEEFEFLRVQVGNYNRAFGFAHP